MVLVRPTSVLSDLDIFGVLTRASRDQHSLTGHSSLCKYSFRPRVLCRQCLNDASRVLGSSGHYTSPYLLSLATEELSIRVGTKLAGLINASLVCASFHVKLSFPSISQNILFACRVTREFFLLAYTVVVLIASMTLPSFKRLTVSR